MKARLVRCWMVAAYFLSWGWFMTGGLLLNLPCLPLFLVPQRARFEPAMRALIRRLFTVWLGWFRVSGCIRIVWRGFDAPLSQGTVYVANHPTLLDATWLLARLPHTICIFKPALLRNPAVGAAALLAGYPESGKGIDWIRDVAARVAAGRSLLIFPEGTRTQPGAGLNPLKPAYALIAERAGAPVQLIVIRASPDLAPRGRPWWRPPAVLPARAEILLDRRWEPDPSRRMRDLTGEIGRRLSEVLASPP